MSASTDNTHTAMGDNPQLTTRGSASHSLSIGITQRSTPLAFAWTADQRLRFSDFQVNEIGLDGAVLHLHKIGMSEQKTRQPQQKQLNEGTSQARKQEEKREKKQEVTKAEKQGEAARETVGCGKQDEVQQNAPEAEKRKKKKDAPEAEKEDMTEPPSLSAPQEQKEQKSNQEAKNNREAKDNRDAETELSAADLESLASLAGSRFTQDLVKLFRGQEGPDGKVVTKATSDTLKDKAQRGRIHAQVGEIFKSRIETSTDSSGIITATKQAPRRGRKRAPRGPADERRTGEYLHFTLYKDNRDTMDAVNHIARALHIKTHLIGYAGTKDRRASTVQRCSARRVGQRALAGAAQKLWGITTGDYGYSSEPIRLGQLMGNEFVITLKNCAALDAAVARQPLADRMQALGTSVQTTLHHMACHGWINYFGHQRFGTYHVGTHDIGKLILGERWEEAVMALLSYDADIAAKAASGEVPSEAVKRDEFARHHACMLFKEKKEAQKAAQTMPARFAAESCILRHLTRPGTNALGDYSGALTHITRGLRSMYLHAYQSYVWNHVASRRWELHGDKVIEGDLVLADGPPDDDKQHHDDDDDAIVHPADNADDAPAHARPLSAQEAASGRFSILDVILPSPGYHVVYPANHIGAFYSDFMARPENGALDPLRMRRSRREFSLPGRYRKLVACFLVPPSIGFRLYADDMQQMHPTDLDTIRTAKPQSHSSAGRKHTLNDSQDGHDAANKKPRVEQGAHDDTENAANSQPGGVPHAEPSKIAAVFKFQLGSSAYATVVLRELMGDVPQDVAVATQATAPRTLQPTQVT